VKLTLPPRIAVGFAAAILAVVASALATARSLAEWRDFRAQVTHTFETRNALQRTMLLVRDAESGQRGFVLTGREHYLGQYLRARENLEPTLARAREFTRGDDPQERQVAALEPLIRQRFAFAERVIGLRRASGLEAAVALIEGGEGVRLMDDIESRLEAIRQEEREILERKQQEWSRSNVVSTAIFAAGDVVLLLLVVLAAKLVRDELRERERREEERARMLEMQKHLMGIVGHDLRSPLAAIHTSA
jgi:CHASE3 domain sensor protein